MRKQQVVRLRVPKPTPNEVGWEPEFQYECSKCTTVVSPKKALEKTTCPIVWCGTPCTGTLVRFGKGTGRGSHFRKAESA